ncbi:MAG TPA: DNRLRE domain-containing protein, partial [Thermoanaerobaculia bacterium]|nr:DNRLRE domain-containing protein [Thermoanaerobaculia bacterium]
MNAKKTLMGYLLLGFGLAVASQAQTFTLPLAADTYLSQTLPNQSFGGATALQLGTPLQLTGTQRILLRVDQAAFASAVGSGRVASASLELFVTSAGLWGSDPRAVEAHRLTADWTEAGATWSCGIDTKPANTRPDCAAEWNGGTFTAQPSATVLQTQAEGVWMRFDVTADVAAFLAGAPNRGWLLKAADEAGAGQVGYASREGAAAERPRLILQVDADPPIVSFIAPADGSFVTTATPTISATYSDAGSGIDVEDVHLAVDDVDRTAEAQVTASALTFTPASPLAEGPHTATLVVLDRVGHTVATFLSFTIDTVPPSLAFTAPAESIVLGDPTPAIAVAYSDDTAGLDSASLQIALDGTSLLPNCTVGPSSAACEPAPLAEGSHTATALIRDYAGLTATASLTFDVVLDLDPPSIILTAPAEGSFLKMPEVLVTGTVTDDGEVASVTVNDVAAALDGDSFQATVTLPEGFNEIFVVATDATGKQSFATRTVTIDLTPPSLSVETPTPGQLTNQQEIRVAGEATDENGVAGLTVQQATVAVSEDRFETAVPVTSGSNLISLRAVDRAGNETATEVQVIRFDLPEVKITSPEDLSFLAATTVDVSGTVSSPGATVTVNGVAAAVAGTSFTAAEVPLIEGGNILTATATDTNGHVGTDSINVVRDLSAPRLAIHYPKDGAALLEPTVTVSGMVNDIVAGTVNASEATVIVNGRPATVANRSFVVEGVPLTPGDNVLTAEATDASGNVGQASITVHLAPANVPRIAVVSGNQQEAVIGTALPAPLVVSLLDAAGQPVIGKPVLFKLRGNNGSLDGGKRQIAVTTDASGRASAHFTLGTRAGVGNQVVEASSPGFAGPAVFTATARPGDAAFIVVDSGDQQVGIAGQELPRPLVAVVTDAGHNRLEGAPVRFNVAKGRGHFANGLQEALVFSDGDGRLILPLTLDAEEGIANNVVEAKIEGLDPSPVASFVASGRAAGDPAATSISGVVLDNSNLPIAGVTLRILDSPLTARTDEKGLFQIAGAPVGTVKLIADGSTAERPGSWPDLEFVLTTIPGRDNTINMPIYLLPLDVAHGIQVDETHGGTLALPEIPGFALEILPGSVTFPGGSRSGVVSVTAVHNDKVPMVPNFGQQPRFIVTIQPAGARFEPPARLTLPNVEGLSAGEVTEMYSFDHDLGHFVSIGPATVSEDGAAIVSDPGVGIIKAGWHCGGDPNLFGAAHDCPQCQRCSGSECIPDDSQTCTLDECKINTRCSQGLCLGTPVEVTGISGPCAAAKGEQVTFSSTSNAPDKVKWEAYAGLPDSGTGASFTTSWVSGLRRLVTAGCSSPQATKYIWLADVCSVAVPTLIWVQKSGTPPPCTGLGAGLGNTAPTGSELTPGRCADTQRLCLKIEKFEAHYVLELNDTCVTDVPDANAPIVTETTCQAIIDDLTPPPAGSPVGPLHEHFWVRWITEKHEQFHLTQLKELVTNDFLPALLSLLSEDRWCDDACSAYPKTPPAGLEQEIAALWDHKVTVPWNDVDERRLREIAAHDADRPD